MNRYEEMARAACDALGMKFDETSPSEIKARIYEMWDGLNAKLAEPILLEVAPPELSFDQVWNDYQKNDEHQSPVPRRQLEPGGQGPPAARIGGAV